MGPLLRSCVEVREPIELSFGMMNGVGLGIDVRNGGPHSLGEVVDFGIVCPHWPMGSMAWFLTEMYSTRA